MDMNLRPGGVQSQVMENAEVSLDGQLFVQTMAFKAGDTVGFGFTLKVDPQKAVEAGLSGAVECKKRASAHAAAAVQAAGSEAALAASARFNPNTGSGDAAPAEDRAAAPKRKRKSKAPAPLMMDVVYSAGEVVDAADPRMKVWWLRAAFRV